MLASLKTPAAATANPTRYADRPLEWALWIMIGLVACGLAAWPVMEGIEPVVDNFIMWLRQAHMHSPWEAISFYWTHLFFRPVDFLSHFLADTDTLDSWPVLATHVPAVVAIVLAMRRALKRLTPDISLVFPLSVLWFLLNNGTAVTVWQTVSISQTWSGALGLWLGLLVWDVLDRVALGRAIRWHVAGIAGLAVAGMLSKEIFAGWCAGYAGLLFAFGIYHLVRRRRATGALLLGLGVVLVGIPVAYLLLRMEAGGLHTVGKYTAHFGLNVIRNAVLGIGGYFATGPIHVLLTPGSYWWAKALLLATVCINAAFALAGCVLGPPGEMSPDRRRSRKWILVGIGVLTYGGISAGFPTANISEVYLMGPDAGAAILVVVGIVAVLDRFRARIPGPPRVSGRCLAGYAAAGVVLVSGLYGLVSHAAHFRVTWAYARGLEREVAAAERSLARAAKSPVEITLAGRYATPGFHHSTYILEPSGIVAPENLEAWVNRHRKAHDIRIRVARPGEDTAPPGDVVIVPKADEVPPRPRW